MRECFDRHLGSKTELAKLAGVSRCAVTNWLQGGTSANISKHAVLLYAELREKERALASAA
jgi:transcriptional regulator with XRE-family HTH domain